MKPDFGMDVSLKETSVRVVDGAGQTLARGEVDGRRAVIIFVHLRTQT